MLKINIIFSFNEKKTEAQRSELSNSQDLKTCLQVLGT